MLEAVKSELIRLHTRMARIHRLTDELFDDPLTAPNGEVFSGLMERQYRKVDSIYEAFNQADRLLKTDAERNQRFTAILASLELVNEKLREIQGELDKILGKD